MEDYGWFFMGLFIALAFMMVFFIVCHIGEGDPRESLLNYSCNELKLHHISQDGPDKMFVSDVTSFRWVPIEKMDAAIEFKKCNFTNSENKINITKEFFYYR